MRRSRRVVLALAVLGHTAQAADWMKDESHRIDEAMQTAGPAPEGLPMAPLSPESPPRSGEDSPGYTLDSSQGRTQRLGGRSPAPGAGPGTRPGPQDRPGQSTSRPPRAGSRSRAGQVVLTDQPGEARSGGEAQLAQGKQARGTRKGTKHGKKSPKGTRRGKKSPKGAKHGKTSYQGSRQARDAAPSADPPEIAS